MFDTGTLFSTDMFCMNLAAPLNMPEYVTLNRTADRTVGVHFRGVVTGPDEEPLDGYKVCHVSHKPHNRSYLISNLNTCRNQISRGSF